MHCACARNDAYAVCMQCMCSVYAVACAVHAVRMHAAAGMLALLSVSTSGSWRAWSTEYMTSEASSKSNRSDGASRAQALASAPASAPSLAPACGSAASCAALTPCSVLYSSPVMAHEDSSSQSRSAIRARRGPSFAHALRSTVRSSTGRQSEATLSAPRTAAVSAGNPRPQPSSSTRQPCTCNSRAWPTSQPAKSRAQGHTRQPVPPSVYAHSSTRTCTGTELWRNSKVHRRGSRWLALQG